MAGGAFVMTAVEGYLALRRTVGFAMSNAEYLLRSFARFAAARREEHIRTATLIEWASQAGCYVRRYSGPADAGRPVDFQSRLENAT